MGPTTANDGLHQKILASLRGQHGAEAGTISEEHQQEENDGSDGACAKKDEGPGDQVAKKLHETVKVRRMGSTVCHTNSLSRSW